LPRVLEHHADRRNHLMRDDLSRDHQVHRILTGFAGRRTAAHRGYLARERNSPQRSREIAKPSRGASRERANKHPDRPHHWPSRLRTPQYVDGTEFGRVPLGPSEVHPGEFLHRILLSWRDECRLGGTPQRNPLATADPLSGEGISVEVIDVATLKPLDTDSVLELVAKTRRCVIVYEAPLIGGFGAEIADRGLISLLASIERVAGSTPRCRCRGSSWSSNRRTRRMTRSARASIGDDQLQFYPCCRLSQPTPTRRDH
jgi:hypothetical protein